MRKLNVVGTNVDNSDPTNYPWGKLKNKITGVQSGTLLTEEALGDLIQAMYEVLRVAGIEPDGDPEKKGASQFADAVGFMKPVCIIKVGYDNSSGFDVLGGTYLEGYSAEYARSFRHTGAVTMKLTIKKGGVVSTENYYADVTICSPVDLKDGVTAGASHGSGNAFGYFNNDSSNIYISKNGGSYTDENLEKVNLIVKIFKA